MVAKQGVIRGKKKWFTVQAPEVFKFKEVVDITAYEPTELKGRPVEVNFMQLTGFPKDMQRKLILKIIETRGEKALTEPWRYALIESFIQRSGRRYKEKFISVLKTKSKDGRNIIVKWMALGVKKLHHPVRADLLSKLADYTGKVFPQYNFADLFVPTNVDKIAAEAKKETRNIFPLDKIIIWKMEVE